LNARQRELLEEFAEESGELEVQEAPVTPGSRTPRRSRRKRGFTDRLKDAIS
jgi:hypothetical protein